MTDDSAPGHVSRRNLFGGIALGMLMPQTLSATQVAREVNLMEPSALHALTRGLALLGDLGDPIIDADSEGLLEQIAVRLPEAPMLVALYRDYLGRGAGTLWRAEMPGALGILHKGVIDATRVSFRYIDLEGTETRRIVRPLALVHPPHGIQLLAWCDMRGDYRKFFVASMSQVQATDHSFAEGRFGLLQGLLDEQGIAF